MAVAMVKTRTRIKGDYFKKCGQSFWELISGDLEFYKKIVEPLGIKAKARNEEFEIEYSKVINRFSKEFINNFCDDDGSIDWEKVVEFNSGIDKKVEYKTLEKF